MYGNINTPINALYIKNDNARVIKNSLESYNDSRVWKYVAENITLEANIILLLN
jgi:hypothetical protein